MGNDKLDGLHDRLAREIVALMGSEPMWSGGSRDEAMAVLEAVLAGILLAAVRLSGDETVTDKVLEQVRARVARALHGTLQ